MTEPGLIHHMPEADYFSHPSLSASGMKKLLPPNAPAIFKHEQDHPQTEISPSLAFGRAGHAQLLGVGSERVVVMKKTTSGELVPSTNFDGTKSAQEHVRQIVAEGKTPVLQHEQAVLDGMEAAIRADRLTSRLFDVDEVEPEVSAFWDDSETGVGMRARFDVLRKPDANGVVLMVDYKTAKAADPREFIRSAATYNYPVSAAHYSDALIELGYCREVRFLFVAQSKTAPYLPSVVGLTEDDLRLGRALKRKAIHTWITCTERDEWPGYTTDVHYPGMPTWWTYYAEEASS